MASRDFRDAANGRPRTSAFFRRLWLRSSQKTPVDMDGTISVAALACGRGFRAMTRCLFVRKQPVKQNPCDNRPCNESDLRERDWRVQAKEGKWELRVRFLATHSD